MSCGVLAGRAERQAVVVGERRPGELAQELRDPPTLARAEPPRATARASLSRWTSSDSPPWIPHAPRTSCASRLNAEPARCGSPRPSHTATGAPRAWKRAQELLGEARLPGPRRRRHEHRAPRGLLDALLEQLPERVQLDVPTHARRRPAEQRAGLLNELVLTVQDVPAAVLAHVEARVEQLRR